MRSDLVRRSKSVGHRQYSSQLPVHDLEAIRQPKNSLRKKSQDSQMRSEYLFAHNSKEISYYNPHQNTMKLTITLATLIGSAAAFAPSKMASSSTSLGVVSFSSRAQFVLPKQRFVWKDPFRFLPSFLT
jgi:hypothetical protein